MENYNFNAECSVKGVSNQSHYRLWPKGWEQKFIGDDLQAQPVSPVWLKILEDNGGRSKDH